MKLGLHPFAKNQVSPIDILQFNEIDTAINDDVVKIDMEDIEDEVDFWNSIIVCSNLGANPPLSAIEEFFRRI